MTKDNLKILLHMLGNAMSFAVSFFGLTILVCAIVDAVIVPYSNVVLPLILIVSFLLKLRSCFKAYMEVK